MKLAGVRCEAQQQNAQNHGKYIIFLIPSSNNRTMVFQDFTKRNRLIVVLNYFSDCNTSSSTNSSSERVTNDRPGCSKWHNDSPSSGSEGAISKFFHS